MEANWAWTSSWKKSATEIRTAGQSILNTSRILSSVILQEKTKKSFPSSPFFPLPFFGMLGARLITDRKSGFELIIIAPGGRGQ
jgi:hypothetical protein